MGRVLSHYRGVSRRVCFSAPSGAGLRSASCGPRAQTWYRLPLPSPCGRSPRGAADAVQGAREMSCVLARNRGCGLPRSPRCLKAATLGTGRFGRRSRLTKSHLPHPDPFHPSRMAGVTGGSNVLVGVARDICGHRRNGFCWRHVHGSVSDRHQFPRNRERSHTPLRAPVSPLAVPRSTPNG